MYKNNKGFTYIELITAAIILTLVVAGVYAAFLCATQFAGFFRHDVMAVTGAEGYLDKVRAQNSYDTLLLLDTGGFFVSIPDPDLGTPLIHEDLHLFWGQLETEVDTTNFLTDANPPDYEVSTQDYSGGMHNYDFGRVRITVDRDERGM